MVDYDTSKFRKCGVHGLLPIDEFKKSYAQTKSGKRYDVHKCKECLRTRSRKVYAADPKRRHAFTQSWRERNRERAREITSACYYRNSGLYLSNAKDKRLEKKTIVLFHYSDGESLKCCLCPEDRPTTDVSMLALDHIDGGGTRHRVETGSGDKFYDWIMKNDFPEGYRVLCHNHNFKVHIEKVREVSESDPRFARSRLKRKIEVIRHYANNCRCICCGEADIDVITIDHVDGSGRIHRQSLGYYGLGNNFYTWLRKHGFPPGYQVLCHNCNFAKGLLGRCPHQK